MSTVKERKSVNSGGKGVQDLDHSLTTQSGVYIETASDHLISWVPSGETCSEP
jgi:hypothetical protein